MKTDESMDHSARRGTAAPAQVHNRKFDEISVGDTANIVRTLTSVDIHMLSLLAGGGVRAEESRASVSAGASRGVIAHGMWAAALIPVLLSTRLPGAGTVYQAQTLRFLRSVDLGDTLTATVTVTARDPATHSVVLACTCMNQRGEPVIEGEGRVIAPDSRIAYSSATLPEVRSLLPPNGQRLLDHVQALEAIRMAVVHPCDAPSLTAALDARDAGLIHPVLVAPRAKLAVVAASAGLDLSGLDIEDVPHSHAAAERAVEMVARGDVMALMKGSLHTDELMSAVVASSAGLRTERRMTHCFLMHTPAYPRPFIITDAAINIEPDLETKADIVRNAIDLAHIIGIASPRVAILAAVETVSPAMKATLHAAALCKMADRGQITGGLLDGPLAFDNAVSMAAAHTKGIVSDVAGRADILVVPDMEAGNMLAKQMEYMGNASSAGVVLGAKVPIVLTSRADSRESRLASCALALMVAHHYQASPP